MKSFLQKRLSILKEAFLMHWPEFIFITFVTTFAMSFHLIGLMMYFGFQPYYHPSTGWLFQIMTSPAASIIIIFTLGWLGPLWVALRVREIEKTLKD